MDANSRPPNSRIFACIRGSSRHSCIEKLDGLRKFRGRELQSASRFDPCTHREKSTARQHPASNRSNTGVAAARQSRRPTHSEVGPGFEAAAVAAVLGEMRLVWIVERMILRYVMATASGHGVYHRARLHGRCRQVSTRRQFSLARTGGSQLLLRNTHRALPGPGTSVFVPRHRIRWKDLMSPQPPWLERPSAPRG